MSAARKIQDEPTAVPHLAAEIPEAPGMGPASTPAASAAAADERAAGPGRGTFCVCLHHEDDHRRHGGECLDDACHCRRFKSRKPPNGQPRKPHSRKPYGSEAARSERNRALIADYLERGFSSLALGAKYGLTREAVCQILRRHRIPMGHRVVRDARERLREAAMRPCSSPEADGRPCACCRALQTIAVGDVFTAPEGS